MKRDDMIKFFEHIASRQATHSIKDAFKFKAILSSRKNGNFIDTKYPDNEMSQAADDLPAPSPTPVSSSNMPAPTPALSSFHIFVRNDLPAPTPTPALPSSNIPAHTSAVSNYLPAPIPVQAKTPSSSSYNIPAQASLINTNTLTLDPAFRVDPEIELDPSLDPTFHGPATSNLSVFIPLGYPSPSHTPIPEQPASKRRAKNAETLAIQEAQKFLSQGKRRR